MSGRYREQRGSPDVSGIALDAKKSGPLAAEPISVRIAMAKDFVICGPDMAGINIIGKLSSGSQSVIAHQ